MIVRRRHAYKPDLLHKSRDEVIDQKRRPVRIDISMQNGSSCVRATLPYPLAEARSAGREVRGISLQVVGPGTQAVSHEQGGNLLCPLPQVLHVGADRVGGQR